MKERKPLKLDQSFQRRVARDFYYNGKSRYQRLLRLSYSDELKDIERAKVIYLLHKLDVDNIIVLDRLGYISQSYGIAEKEQIIKDLEMLDIVKAKIDLEQEIIATNAVIKENTKAYKDFQGTVEERSDALLAMCDKDLLLVSRLVSDVKMVQRLKVGKTSIPS